ncbi:acyl-CoA thioesterase [Flavisphingomonas formosensis]|uniref:acyl-CoA thioesterase n=1 Tax=Flavisphingomonas formosensis TaxID=861534 RepID=UPI0012FA3227|nr:acyl-CoA thioesterase domain-containing protein [Sphingomonas formosensis]
MAGYFALEPGDGPLTWHMPVAPWQCVGGPGGFLFGGAGLGACIGAVERSLGRATVWATSQYLSYAPIGSRLDIAVSPLVDGRYTSQARASAHVAGREVLGAALSLGVRPDGPRRQWIQPPEVPGPAECPVAAVGWNRAPDDLHTRIEVRVAKGWDFDRDADGRAILWIRPTQDYPIDRPMLALMGDFVPTSIGNALAREQRDLVVNSLDNCMRFLSLVETEWVLCDVALNGAADGFGHGRMHLFAQDGTLLAMASQSMVIRAAHAPRAHARADTDV